MTTLDSVQKDFEMINKTAGEFLHKLSGNDIKRDIVLAAEMAGLKLLRATKVDLSKISPGTVILGAIQDDTLKEMERFILGWAISNGLDIKDVGKVRIPDDVKNYLPQISQLESSFESVCLQDNIKVEYYPFVAASSALRLVFAGKNLKLLEAKTGLAMTMYHIIAGSKTAPYPASSGKPLP